MARQSALIEWLETRNGSAVCISFDAVKRILRDSMHACATGADAVGANSGCRSPQFGHRARSLQFRDVLPTSAMISPPRLLPVPAATCLITWA